MKLGTLLLRNAVISLSQLEAALRSQILIGGRLGTNLVELDFIDLDTLTVYLAEIRGCRPATQAMFDAVQASTLESFGAELAERFTAFPLGRDPAGTDGLAVAVVDPDDPTVIDALREACGRVVVPHIAPELRLFYYLEKRYGIERNARYVRQGGSSAPAYTDERRRTQPARGIATPPSIRLEPRSRAYQSQVGRSGKTGLGRSGRDAVSDGQKSSSKDRPPLSYRDACSAIDVADSRHGIAEVLIEYARGRFELLAIFLVRDANAIGWRLYVSGDAPDDPPDRSKIQTLSLPLGGASALQEAHDAAGPYRGGPTSAGRPVERTLWSLLELEDGPREMLVVPVLVRRRVVNLVYAHGLGHGAIDDSAAKKLGELARRASRAYTRLIQSSKNANRES